VLLLDSIPIGATPVPLTLIDSESDPWLPALSATLTTDEAKPVIVGVKVSVRLKFDDPELLIVLLEGDSLKTAAFPPESAAVKVEVQPLP
jgi:hypothetical protein